MNISPAEETQIILAGEWESEVAERLSKAWFDAYAIDHKLPDWIRYMHGMSGKKYRYLIDNFIANTADARYLEIGSWQGSTACSAIYGNKCQALCIDNWSDFLWGDTKENVRGIFENNLKNAAGDITDANFIDSDFRKVDYSTLGKFNIYMFDGPHSETDQYDGVIIAQKALDEQYLLIVDDWNGPQVRQGTIKALDDLKSKVICSIEIITQHDDQHPVISHQSSDWHNGYFIGLIQKSVD